MWERALEYIEKKWPALKTPIALLLILIGAFVAGRIDTSWRYEGQIKSLQERLEAKDDQLADYRERLHLVPTDQTAYSRLTNDELKQRALSLVSKIRNFVERIEEEDRKALDAQVTAIRTAKSEEGKNQIWQQYTQESVRSSLEHKSDYDKRFKIETILLRDEILSRLPEETRKGHAQDMYEYPINPLGMKEVADDLERLARSLP